MTIRLMLGTVLLAGWSLSASAAECSYSRKHYDEYLATCSAMDGCQLKTQMKAIVDRECGVQGSPAPVAPKTEAQTEEPQADGKEKSREISLSREQLAEIQQALNVLGYDAGLPDGIVGRRTRQAIASFQERSGLPVTGEPSLEVMQRMSEALQAAQRDEKEPTPPKKCTELSAYQQQLTSVWRAMVAKHSVYKNVQGDLRRMRDELTHEAPWGIYTWRENTALVLQGLNMVGRLTRNLTSFVPQADWAATTVGLTQQRIDRSETWLELLDKGNDIYKLFQDEAEKLLFDAMLGLYADRSPAGRLIKTTTDLAEDLVKLKTMPEDFESMREQMADGISRIDRHMRENEEKLLTYQPAAAMIQALYDAIEAYCREPLGLRVKLP